MLYFLLPGSLSFRSRLLFVALLSTLWSGPLVGAEEIGCDLLVAAVTPVTFTEVVRAKPNAVFIPVLSKDLEVLRTSQFRGPGPQGNMARDLPENQFLLDENSKQLFDLKTRLLALPSRRANMIRVLPGHEDEVRAAVEEQFVVLMGELPAQHPQEYQMINDHLVNRINGKSLSLAELKEIKNVDDSLESLSDFVTADYMLLKKPDGSDDFVVIAGLLAIPTRIAMGGEEGRIGESIVQIHQYVSSDPAKAAFFSKMINTAMTKMFTTPGIIRRNNFFVETDPTLSLPAGRTPTYEEPKITDKNYKGNVFLRVERQTMRALPQSRVVIFTILPKVYSFGQIMTDPELTAAIVKGLSVKFVDDTDDDAFVRKIVGFVQKDLNPHPQVAN